MRPVWALPLVAAASAARRAHPVALLILLFSSVRLSKQFLHPNHSPRARKPPDRPARHGPAPGALAAPASAPHTKRRGSRRKLAAVFFCFLQLAAPRVRPPPLAGRRSAGTRIVHGVEAVSAPSRTIDGADRGRAAAGRATARGAATHASAVGRLGHQTAADRRVRPSRGTPRGGRRGGRPRVGRAPPHPKRAPPRAGRDGRARLARRDGRRARRSGRVSLHQSRASRPHIEVIGWRDGCRCRIKLTMGPPDWPSGTPRFKIRRCSKTKGAAKRGPRGRRACSRVGLSPRAARSVPATHPHRPLLTSRSCSRRGGVSPPCDLVAFRPSVLLSFATDASHLASGRPSVLSSVRPLLLPSFRPCALAPCPCGLPSCRSAALAPSLPVALPPLSPVPPRVTPSASPPLARRDPVPAPAHNPIGVDAADAGGGRGSPRGGRRVPPPPTFFL